MAQIASDCTHISCRQNNGERKDYDVSDDELDRLQVRCSCCHQLVLSKINKTNRVYANLEALLLHVCQTK